MTSSVCSQVVVLPRLASKPRATRPTLEAFFQAAAAKGNVGHTTIDSSPTNRDIIVFGRGGGNQRYQQIIAESRPAYWTARSSKRLIEQIRVQMLKEERRFLRYNPDNGLYIELSRSAVSKQITQDLIKAKDLMDALDLTERTRNSKRNFPEGTLDGGGAPEEPPPLQAASRSLDDLEEPSFKRTKYEHVKLEVGSVARSNASATLTDGSDSAFCYSQESEGGMPSITPFPAMPMMFPYYIPTGASNPGWRSHGSSSTLATLPNDELLADMIRQPIVEIDYAASANQPLVFLPNRRVDCSSSVPMSLAKSAGTSSDGRLAKKTQSMNLKIGGDAIKQMTTNTAAIETTPEKDDEISVLSLGQEEDNEVKLEEYRKTLESYLAINPAISTTTQDDLSVLSIPNSKPPKEEVKKWDYLDLAYTLGPEEMGS